MNSYIDKIYKLNASRLALIKKYKETNRPDFFIKSCDYAKQIIKINPNFKLSAS